jgi:hypothetical protein
MFTGFSGGLKKFANSLKYEEASTFVDSYKSLEKGFMKHTMYTATRSQMQLPGRMDAECLP